AWLGTLTLAVAALVWHFSQLSPAAVAQQSGVLANAVLIGLVASFLVAGARRRLPLYETFIEGAKEGFGVAIGIVPYLVATLGADSFAGRLSCVIQGSTETTFYVLAVYFGSVGIKKTRYALGCALAGEFIGVLAAIGVTYLFFG